MHAHARACMHTHTHMDRHKCMHANTNMHKNSNKNTCMCVHAHTHTHTCAHCTHTEILSGDKQKQAKIDQVKRQTAWLLAGRMMHSKNNTTSDIYLCFFTIPPPPPPYIAMLYCYVQLCPVIAPLCQCHCVIFIHHNVFSAVCPCMDAAKFGLGRVIISGFLSPLTTFLDVLLMRWKDSFNPLFKAILQSVLWVRNIL